jgi:hypothetical protein
LVDAGYLWRQHILFAQNVKMKSKKLGLSCFQTSASQRKVISNPPRIQPLTGRLKIAPSDIKRHGAEKHRTSNAEL